MTIVLWGLIRWHKEERRALGLTPAPSSRHFLRVCARAQRNRSVARLAKWWPCKATYYTQKWSRLSRYELLVTFSKCAFSKLFDYIYECSKAMAKIIEILANCFNFQPLISVPKCLNPNLLCTTLRKVIKAKIRVGLNLINWQGYLKHLDVRALKIVQSCTKL